MTDTNTSPDKNSQLSRSGQQSESKQWNSVDWLWSGLDKLEFFMSLDNQMAQTHDNALGLNFCSKTSLSYEVSVDIRSVGCQFGPQWHIPIDLSHHWRDLQQRVSYLLLMMAVVHWLLINFFWGVGGGVRTNVRVHCSFVSSLCCLSKINDTIRYEQRV